MSSLTESELKGDLDHEMSSDEKEPKEPPKLIHELCACGSKLNNNPRNIKRHMETKKHVDFVNGKVSESKGAIEKKTKTKKSRPSKTEGLYVSASTEDNMTVYTIMSDAGIIGTFSVPNKK